jgi:hypothetical protein
MKATMSKFIKIILLEALGDIFWWWGEKVKKCRFENAPSDKIEEHWLAAWHRRLCT